MGPRLPRRGAPPAAKRAIATALAGLAALVVGCGLFDPRDPESPSAGTSCRTRISPQEVVTTIEESYGKLAGINCYVGTLMQSFRFRPDPTDSVEDQPNVYANWNLNVEDAVARDIAADTFFVATVFDSEYALPTISPDLRTETRYFAYHVFTRPRGGGDSTRYQGLADITFRRGDDEFWAIATWQDKRDGSGYPTWGRLRGKNRTVF